MKLTILAASLVLASSAAALADGADVVASYAEKALAKGYGGSCSLAMVPSATDGYYPCLDFGPYRYVREYQKVSAYVVGPDQKPFKVMGGSLKDTRFTIGGPWEQDMPARMVAFWNDVVEGGASKAASAKQTTKERQDAEAYIRKMMGGDDAQAPQSRSPETVGPSGLASPTMTTDEVKVSRQSGTAAPLDVDESDIKEIMKKHTK